MEIMMFQDDKKTSNAPVSAATHHFIVIPFDIHTTKLECLQTVQLRSVGDKIAHDAAKFTIMHTVLSEDVVFQTKINALSSDILVVETSAMMILRTFYGAQ